MKINIYSPAGQKNNFFVIFQGPTGSGPADEEHAFDP